MQLLQSVDESRERDDPMANRLGPALVSALAKLEDLERLGSVSRMLDASTIIETLNEIRHEIDSAVGDETLFAVKAMQHTISKFFHSQEVRACIRVHTKVLLFFDFFVLCRFHRSKTFRNPLVSSSLLYYPRQMTITTRINRNRTAVAQRSVAKLSAWRSQSGQ